MTIVDKIQEDIVTFFNSILERRFTEAERTLSSIELGLVLTNIHSGRSSKKRKQDKMDYVAGYIKALEGILTAARSGDRRTFINRMSNDSESLNRYRRDFGAFIKNKLHSPFDRGFFSAWSDFIIHIEKRNT